MRWGRAGLAAVLLRGRGGQRALADGTCRRRNLTDLYFIVILFLSPATFAGVREHCSRRWRASMPWRGGTVLRPRASRGGRPGLDEGFFGNVRGLEDVVEFY